MSETFTITPADVAELAAKVDELEALDAVDRAALIVLVSVAGQLLADDEIHVIGVR